MAQIRCSKCGGLNFRDNGVIVECTDCHSITYAIPAEAVTKLDNPLAADGMNPKVTMEFDRRMLGNPRRGFCINDADGKCEVCNVLRNRFAELAGTASRSCAEAAEFMEAHPELREKEEFGEAYKVMDAVSDAMETLQADEDAADADAEEGEIPDEDGGKTEGSAKQARKTYRKKK